MMVLSPLKKVEKANFGFSLIELMVATAIGIVLLLGMIIILVNSKQDYLESDELTQLQENGRFATQILSRELSMAGFWGGILDVETVEPIEISGDCGSGAWGTNIEGSIEVMNNPSVSEMKSAYSCFGSSDTPISGADLITIKRLSDRPVVEGNTSLTGFNKEQVYLQVRQHSEEASFVKGDNSGNPINTDGSHDLWNLMVSLFYIGSVDGVPALCQKKLIGFEMSSGPDAECSVLGIEDLQLQFGIDDDDDLTADRYSDDPGDMSNAVAIRIFVLARSLEEISGYVNDKSYELGSKTIAPANDGFLRRVHTTTVKLHNSGAIL